MKKPNVALAIVLAGGASVAQTKGAVKESGKAVAEKAMEGKESVQAAATTDPAKKSVHKGSAKSHKATAPKRDRKAKAAGWIGLGDEAGARTAVVLQTLRRNLGTISQ